MRKAFLAFTLATAAVAQKPAEPLPTLAAKTAAMTAMPGLLPLYWDPLAGHLYLEIPQAPHDFLYTNSLPYGTGSNDLGLDRGQTAEARIVHFERTGPRVLLVEANQMFRSTATAAPEQLAVTQSFPTSVLAGFTVAAESPTTYLVDATDFFLRDAHGVLEALTRTQQGSYKLDPARSTIALDHTKAFPRNTEVEATLTFTTDTPSRRSYVADVTPDPRALTLREHQSFLELPGPGFVPRRYDPRAGYFPTTYRDYNAPLGAPLDQQFILRHRLVKKDPACRQACEPVTPIQYYVDTGAPEPIRTALVEGARWWDTAFQAAGWAPGTFRVDPLPAGADPMDVRYNIIQWVHRYTRGWSYGAAVADPRTGEIIKGNVTLGSLRGRQDYLIAEALLAPYASATPQSGGPSFPASSERVGSSTSSNAGTGSDPMLAMVLQRIRQLSAHETGHTLGLAHNFAASAFPHADLDQTVSVMDYPHPYITLTNGIPDLSHAYPVGIGIWDKVAIDYGYRQFNARYNEPAELDKILVASEKTGLLFITDEDARPFSSAQPYAHLWDNGPDPAAELDRILAIRAVAFARFGPANIRPGTPQAQLADTLVPLFLLHRYQAEAATKMIGGLNYTYQLRGSAQANPAILDNASQQRAITAVLQTLSPATLTLPESILAVIPPRPPSLPRTQESFATETGLTFDPIAAAEQAADLTLQVLLDPARASRIVQYHMRLNPSPSLRVLLEQINKTVAQRPVLNGKEAGHTIEAEVGRAIEFRAVEAMFTLATNPAASSQVRAITRSHLEDELQLLEKQPPSTDSAEQIHRRALIARIQLFQADPQKFTPAKPIEAPPGMPIGDEDDY